MKNNWFFFFSCIIYLSGLVGVLISWRLFGYDVLGQVFFGVSFLTSISLLLVLVKLDVKK